MKITVLLMFFLTGCVDMQQMGRNIVQQERSGIASGFIGCPPDQIEIKDNRQNSWTAVCKDKIFYCSPKSCSPGS